MLPACVAGGASDFCPTIDEPRRAAGQNFASGIANFAGLKNISAFEVCFKRLDGNFFVHAHGLQILNIQFRGHRSCVTKPANFSHGFVEQYCNDSAMAHTASTLIPRTQDKLSHDALADVVLRERQLHSAVVRAAAAETFVLGIGRQSDCVGQISSSLSSFAIISQTSATRLRSARRKPRWRLRISMRSISARVMTPRVICFSSKPGERQAQRVGQRILHVKISAGSEEHAALFHVNQQLAGVKARRQLQPQAHAAFRTRPARLFRHVFSQRLRPKRRGATHKLSASSPGAC